LINELICSSDVEVPFYWVMVRPHCAVFAPDCNNSSAVPTEHVQDVDSPFSIDPEMGVLPALGTASFTVTFAPSSVNA